MKKSKLLRRSLGAVAAVLAVLLLAGTAYATNMFGLRDQILGEKKEIYAPEVQEDGTIVESTREVYIISLQGYAGSNEYKAVAEWVEFLDSYDQDGSILNDENSDADLELYYKMYGAYSREMADKLDEIAEKYGLLLHGEYTPVDSEELMEAVAYGNFIGETNTAYGGRVYADGTFHFEGNMVDPEAVYADHFEETIVQYDSDSTSPEELYSPDDWADGAVIVYIPYGGSAEDAVVADYSSGELTFVPYEGDTDLDKILNHNDDAGEDFVGFQFGSCKKGYLDTVLLSIGNIDDYTQWEYETACGITVSLAKSSYHSLLIADLEDAFVTVNILDDNGSLSASELEAFADSLDLTLLK